MDEDGYRYECRTLEGFVQRVVVLAQKGYTHFVQGRVPERKLLEKYDVGHTSRQRYRRKKKGLANVHYVRHGRDWVLLITAGKHELFEKVAVEAERAFTAERERSLEDAARATRAR